MTGKIHWRCFHCDATFTKAQRRWALEHFGRDQDSDPVCLIRTAGEDALLSALRKRENELVAYRAEDQDLLRALCAAQADHAQALVSEEERGYAKGVADARLEYERAIREACDLLAERVYGSTARSPGHNARLILERALAGGDHG